MRNVLLQQHLDNRSVPASHLTTEGLLQLNSLK